MREGLAVTLVSAKQELQAQGIKEDLSPESVAREVEHALYILMGMP